jgi:hypothetical protein
MAKGTQAGHGKLTVGKVGQIRVGPVPGILRAAVDEVVQLPKEVRPIKCVHGDSGMCEEIAKVPRHNRCGRCQELRRL